MNQDSMRPEEHKGQGRPYISRAVRNLNRPGSATRAKLSFSFEKIEA